jgi:hypothetical protein
MEESKKIEYMQMAMESVEHIFESTPLGKIKENISVVVGVSLMAMQEEDEDGREAKEMLPGVIGIAILRMTGTDPLDEKQSKPAARPDIDLSFLDE